MDNVGDEIKTSEKLAVIVTTSEFLTIWLEELSVKITVGLVLSLTLILISLIHPLKGLLGLILPVGDVISLPFPIIPYLGD